MKVKYYKNEGVFRFVPMIIGKRISIFGSSHDIHGEDISDENYEKLKEAGFDLKTMRDDRGRNQFIFPVVIDYAAIEKAKEESFNRRDAMMDVRVTAQKEAQELKVTRKTEKEAMEVSGELEDEFGPLENTPAWNKLASYNKGQIRNKREVHYNYRVVKYKGGVIERTNEEPKEEKLSLDLTDELTLVKPKGKTLSDV